MDVPCSNRTRRCFGHELHASIIATNHSLVCVSMHLQRLTHSFTHSFISMCRMNSDLRARNVLVADLDESAPIVALVADVGIAKALESREISPMVDKALDIKAYQFILKQLKQRGCRTANGSGVCPRPLEQAFDSIVQQDRRWLSFNIIVSRWQVAQSALATFSQQQQQQVPAPQLQQSISASTINLDHSSIVATGRSSTSWLQCNKLWEEELMDLIARNNVEGVVQALSNPIAASAITVRANLAVIRMLMGAITSGNTRLSLLLLERSVSCVIDDEIEGTSVMHEAVRYHRRKVLAELLVSPVFSSSINRMDHQADTPLHIAARVNDLKALKMLLDAKANPHAKNDYGNVPLHDAASWGHHEILVELIIRRANTNERNDEMLAPLVFAARGHHYSCISSLLSYGAEYPSPCDAHALSIVLDIAKSFMATYVVCLPHGSCHAFAHSRSPLSRNGRAKSPTDISGIRAFVASLPIDTMQSLQMGLLLKSTTATPGSSPSLLSASSSVICTGSPAALSASYSPSSSAALSSSSSSSSPSSSSSRTRKRFISSVTHSPSTLLGALAPVGRPSLLILMMMMMIGVTHREPTATYRGSTAITNRQGRDDLLDLVV